MEKKREDNTMNLRVKRREIKTVTSRQTVCERDRERETERGANSAYNGLFIAFLHCFFVDKS
jgi:hypothetical protein